MRPTRITCYCILQVMFLGSLAVAKNEAVLHELLAATPQEFTYLIQDAAQLNQPIAAYDLDEVQEIFLAYYFAPWHHPLNSFSLEVLGKKEKDRLEECSKHQYPRDFIKSISDNMALSTFPNQGQQQPAIVVHTTHLRSMPSMNTPLASSQKFPQDYSSDVWQESLLAPNEPLCVLHTSQDRVWNYVITGNYINGWVQRADIAYVTHDFMKKWQTGTYVTPLRDKLFIRGNIFASLARIGQLMPLAPTQKDEEHYHIFTVSSDLEGMATIQVGMVDKAGAAIMPLLATPRNMIGLASNLLGQPYAWGGLAGYRDCSSTLKDLFFPFGIWLPRDSGPQSKAGDFVSLKGLSNDLKEKKIIEKGAPFFSVIWQPGHVMLYVGARDGKSYVYNNIWGLRTRDSDGKKGRAIVGRTVIMPLSFGKEHEKIEATRLDKAEGLILLKSRLASPNAELTLFKK